ncbi:hypothetical protein Fot_36129 [Forsythia ovata]|uniref:Uncharacterized protein n=1 Tax=Forsythia ovata TaxID=205694 RepID=A0ABD1SNJ0_9LAMI
MVVEDNKVMIDEDKNTRTRQTGEQQKGEDERAPEVTQPPRRGRRSRARMARNMEVMAEQNAKTTSCANCCPKCILTTWTYAPCATHVSALPAPRIQVPTLG